jgi:hypothetical protein
MLMLNNFMFQFGASIILGHLQAYAVYELHYTPTNAALLYTISGVMVLYVDICDLWKAELEK